VFFFEVVLIVKLFNVFVTVVSRAGEVVVFLPVHPAGVVPVVNGGFVHVGGPPGVVHPG
jgi:hypothetical protein